MERREVLASNIGAIAGVAFVDQNADGSPVGDPAVPQNTQIQLFEDVNGNNVFDPGVGADQLRGTDFTDAGGNYRFDGLAPGTYFVQQAAVAGLSTPPLLQVDVVNDAGVQVAAIDRYQTATLPVSADAGTPSATAFTTAIEAIGGERDVQVTHTAGTSSIELEVDPGGSELTISTGAGTLGTALLQYDGTDGVITLDPTGLGGQNLSDGDSNAGVEVAILGDNPGGTLEIRVFSSATDFSVAQISIPDTSVQELIFVPFDPATFVPDAGGSGADFTNVGAIEAFVTTVANLDVMVTIIESRRPDVVTANLANIQPIELGGLVFVDSSTTGQNDGVRQGTEPGVTNVIVELYQLANATDVVDPANDTPINFMTTVAGGVYSFPGLDPGHYAVVVPASQFLPGATLFGFENSTGNDPASDPDDNVDNDDNGTRIGTGDVITGTITLVSNSEPTNDDDSNPNTNTTLDLGFFPQIDLSITKSLNVAASNVAAGGNAVFDIVVQNAGPLDASNVEVEDVFPSGLTFTGIANASGSFSQSVNGSTVTIGLGTIPASGSASFQMTSDIAANQTSDVTNTATVTATEVDTNLANNSDDELLDLIESDLRIEKIDLTDPVNAGNQLTYQITVTNDGPDAAAGVIVTDPLPVGVDFDSGNVDGATNLVTFDAVSRTVTATVGNLSATAGSNTSVITIVVNVAADAVSPLTNNATVSANPNTDPDQSNNNTSENTVVEREVDVAVTKSVTGAPIAGQNVTYTIDVVNNGPSQARGVSVADTLDGNLTLVPGSFNPGTSGVTLSQSGQDLTFDVGVLDAASTASFSFDVTIASSATGTISNAATAASTDTDSDSTNNTGSADIVVQQQVDLILTKDVDRSTAIPGQDQLIYTFTVSHDTDSSSDAANVVVTDVLPSDLIGAVIDAPTADGTDFTNPTVTVTYNNIPVGETRTFTVTVDINDSATGSVTNPASVTTSATDIDSTNDSDTATTALTPNFDVVVSKSVNNTTPSPTSSVVYTVGLANTGPSTATGIVLTDTIPSGLTFVSGTLNGQSGVSNGATVTFPAITLAPNSSSSATLNFTVDAAASGTITNTASVPNLSAAGETDTTNNSATADITVTPLADVSIAKTVSAADAQVGGSLTYTVTVSNAGPSPATNVQVQDTLPAGVTFTSGTGPNGESLSASAGVVTVNGGTVASGGSFMFTIIGTVAAGASGTQVNTATVTTDTNESNTSNNSASASTDVDPMTASISGVVYVDRNNNGNQEAGENGIANVVLTLTGTDSLGNSVNATVTTDANGNYTFANLAQGTYTVTETQPPGFRDGIETAGSGANATVADNVFSDLGLAAAATATDFNFGELNELLSKRRFLASST